MNAQAQPARPAVTAEQLRRAKDAAKLAFSSYEFAVRNGDIAGQEAAKSRFIAASSVLKSGGQ